MLELLKVERDAIAAKAIAAYCELKKHNYCFSGFYELNSADFLHESEKPDIYTCVYDFTRNNFVEDENGRVFIKHAYDAFSSLSEDLSLEVFSKIFSTCTAQVFNAVNTGKKARLKNSKNPLHYISGIKWREY